MSTFNGYNTRPGSITIKYDNVDAGGDGVPWARKAAPITIECENVEDITAALALQTAAGVTAAGSFTVSTDLNVEVSITEATCNVSLSGDGVQIAKITAKGNEG